MKYLAIAVLAGFWAQGALASEQQPIPDLSLSPEETAKQPNIAYSHDPFVPAGAPQSGASGYGGSAIGGTGYTNGYNGGYNNYSNNNFQNNAPDSLIGFSSNQFMSGYCDPNYKGGVGVSPALQSCLAASRKEACARYGALPKEVQAVLDHTIGCTFQASESLSEQSTPTDASCATGDDTKRLQLLKKYWSDQNAAYALVFLPDMVLNASDSCMGVKH